MKIDGGCHCGNITFTAEIDPEKIVVCHCTDCQMLTGSAFRVIVRTPASAVEWRGGKAKSYVKKTADSGTPRVQAFCPECGTPLYSTCVGEPDMFGLRLGTIRQNKQLRPSKQTWYRSAHEWALDLRALPRTPKQG
jgi:hypothetical protein